MLAATWIKKAAYCLIALSMVVTVGAAGDFIRRGVKVTESVMLNTKKYGDEQNSSYLAVSGTVKGDQVWNQGTLPDDLTPPVHLAIKNSFLIVRYKTRVDVRNRETGQLVWSRQLPANFHFDLKPEGLVTLDQSGYYEMLGLDQNVSGRMSLPFLSNNTVLYLSHRQDKEIFFAYQAIPTPTNAPGDIFQGPSFTFTRFHIEKDDFIWQFRRPEILIDVLFTRDRDRFCICTERNVYLFGRGSDSDSSVKTIPFEQIRSCAFDHQGNLLVVGRQEKEGKIEKDISLKKMSPDGRLFWQYVLGRFVNLGQPPATLPDGTVFLIAGTELFSIKDGDVVWKYHLPSKPDSTYMTLLDDGSALVAGGVALIQLSAGGEEIKKVLTGDPLTERPLMDENGRVYIGGVKGIRCLK